MSCIGSYVFFHDYSMYTLYSLQIPEILRGMTTGSLLTLVSANRSLSVPRPSLFSPPFNRVPTLLVCASGWKGSPLSAHVRAPTTCSGGVTFSTRMTRRFRNPVTSVCIGKPSVGAHAFYPL